MTQTKLACIFVFLILFAACNKGNQDQSQAQPGNQQAPITQQQAAAPATGQPAGEAPGKETVQPGVQPSATPETGSGATASNVTPSADYAHQSEAAPAMNVPYTPPVPPRPRVALIPAGTKLAIRLQDALDSGVNKTGDTFAAILDEDIDIDGNIAAPRGSAVTGKLVKVLRSGRVEGRAELAMTLNEIRVGNAAYPIATNTLTSVAESTKKQDAVKIGGGAGIGAAIGAIAGGGKGAAIGAAVGGGAGTAAVLGTRGKEVKYSSEQRLTFSLSGDLKVPLR
jgi:hypothetical protein